MKWFKHKFGLIAVLVEALFKAPGTKRGSARGVKLPKGSRGAIVIQAGQCSGCGLCVRDCPANALILEKESAQKYRLIYYPARCAYCGQCEESCRNNAISHSLDLPETTAKTGEIIQILKDHDETHPKKPPNDD